MVKTHTFNDAEGAMASLTFALSITAPSTTSDESSPSMATTTAVTAATATDIRDYVEAVELAAQEESGGVIVRPVHESQLGADTVALNRAETLLKLADAFAKRGEHERERVDLLLEALCVLGVPLPYASAMRAEVGGAAPGLTALGVGTAEQPPANRFIVRAWSGNESAQLEGNRVVNTGERNDNRAGVVSRCVPALATLALSPSQVGGLVLYNTDARLKATEWVRSTQRSLRATWVEAGLVVSELRMLWSEGYQPVHSYDRELIDDGLPPAGGSGRSGSSGGSDRSSGRGVSGRSGDGSSGREASTRSSERLRAADVPAPVRTPAQAPARTGNVGASAAGSTTASGSRSSVPLAEGPTGSAAADARAAGSEAGSATAPTTGTSEGARRGVDLELVLSQGKGSSRPPHDPRPTAHGLRPITHSPRPRATTRDPQPVTHNPRPTTRDPQPVTHNPRPTTRDPQPATRNP